MAIGPPSRVPHDYNEVGGSPGNEGKPKKPSRLSRLFGSRVPKESEPKATPSHGLRITSASASSSSPLALSASEEPALKYQLERLNDSINSLEGNNVQLPEKTKDLLNTIKELKNKLDGIDLRGKDRKVLMLYILHMVNFYAVNAAYQQDKDKYVDKGVYKAETVSLSDDQINNLKELNAQFDKVKTRINELEFKSNYPIGSIQYLPSRSDSVIRFLLTELEDADGSKKKTVVSLKNLESSQIHGGFRALSDEIVTPKSN